MAGGSEWPAGDEPGSDPRARGVWGEIRPWHGGRWVMKSVFSDSCSRVVPKGIICGNKSLSGLVDVGGTWLCPASLQGEELNHIEQSAILTGLQEKHLTHLYNPRWLKGPLSARGSRDLWTVEIPAELLP